MAALEDAVIGLPMGGIIFEPAVVSDISKPLIEAGYILGGTPAGVDILSKR
jgi:hypothetical protein